MRIEVRREHVEALPLASYDLQCLNHGEHITERFGTNNLPVSQTGHHDTDHSAAWAFTRTFSPRKFQSTRRPSGATNILPVELLLFIFKLVFERDAYWDLSLGWYDFDAASPSLCPFAIAAVCSLWRDVMSLVPAFWKRVVIFVDSHTAFPSAAASQFLWSRDLPLEVVVTSRAGGNRLEEAGVMSTIMGTYINPNLHRIRTLRFNVRSSSCLPLFPGDFHGTASRLIRLRLACNEDDGCNNVRVNNDETEPVTPMDPQFPALDTLLVDGRTYFNACRSSPARWIEATANVDDLTVSHFTPRAGESFPSHAFALPLTAVDRLRYLRIVNVHLSSSASHPAPAPYLEYVEHLELHDFVDFEPAAEMISLVESVFEIVLIRCSLGRPADFGAGGYLTLKDIDESEDMVPLLCAWQGERLSVTKCPGFTDRVLDAMCADTGVSTCARGLTRIHIADCPNFTVSALKRLVAGLMAHLGLRFEAVKLSGSATRLLGEDLLWFTQNVEEFEYEGVDVSDIFQRIRVAESEGCGGVMPLTLLEN